MKSILLLLLVFVATTSVISGILLIINPGGELFMMSTSILEHTSFKDFSIPGFVLATVVGSTNLAAVSLLSAAKTGKYNWAMLGGLTMGGWIIVQIILIREFSWFQVVYLAIALGIMLLALHLKVKSLV
jgi:hypothetical protein